MNEERDKIIVKKGIYSEGEKLFIQKNYTVMTDKELAEQLGRKEDSIIQQRKRLKLKKGIGRPKANPKKLLEKDYLASDHKKTSMADLNKTERKVFAVQLFESSNDYKRFAKQFTAEEMTTYADLFSEYLSEWQEILPHEIQQLHVLIKETIIQDRFLARIKSSDSIKDKIGLLENQRLELMMNINRTPDEEKKMNDVQDLLAELRNNLEPVEHMWKEYHESAARAEKIFRALKLTREQRLKDRTEQGITLVSISQKLNDALLREQEGERAALLNKEMDDCKEKIKKDGYMFGAF